jgi:uncharacterized protein YkwD
VEFLWFFLWLVNLWRGEASTEPLYNDPGLNYTAQVRASELAGSGSLDNHAGFGRVVDTYWPAHCYGLRGENLGLTGGSVQTIYNMWLESPPHAHSLMTWEFNRYGYAEVWWNGFAYVVMHFGYCR